jgi:hypothetical protein
MQEWSPVCSATRLHSVQLGKHFGHLRLHVPLVYDELGFVFSWERAGFLVAVFTTIVLILLLFEGLTHDFVLTGSLRYLQVEEE